MPFVAERVDGEGRVCINDYDNPRQAFEGIEFVCPDCHVPMLIRAGEVTRPHFAHYPGYEHRPCYWRAYAESETHMEAKRMIANALRRSPVFRDGKIEIEYKVDTAIGRRYVDVYLEMPDGRRFAHEAQLAGQSIADFKRRTEAYQSIDLIPVWWLGGMANTEENVAWCDSNCPYVGRIGTSRDRPQIINERYDDQGNLISGNGWAR